jgi:hypothetical protein
MKSTLKKLVLAVAVVSLTAMPGLAEDETYRKNAPRVPETLYSVRERPASEPLYEGEPLSYWIDQIRRRDENGMLIAFDAIRYLGPAAQSGVPALAAVVNAPFAPIELGKDSDDVILSKLWDIEIRTEAIRALAHIGPTAAPATLPLIDWAVTLRVIPAKARNSEDDDRYIDFVMMDGEQRLHVVLAIALFGDAAIPPVLDLLKSSDAEKRALAVAVLGEEALWIAADLLRSDDCEEAQLGIEILEAMEPVFANKYLPHLKTLPTCFAN